MIKIDDRDGTDELFTLILDLCSAADLAIVDVLAAVSRAEGYTLYMAREENQRRNAGVTEEDLRAHAVSQAREGAGVCAAHYMIKDREDNEWRKTTS